MRTLLIVVVATLSLSSCSGRTHGDTFTEQYLNALREIPAEPFATPEALARFEAVFHNLTSDGLTAHIQAAYAEELFFNDTLHTFASRAELQEYLGRTGERLQHMEVRILGWSRQDNEFYVRWLMNTGYRVMGRDRDVTTVGMTHLRFDSEGRIAMHQDFWDSTQGLYEQIPLLGGVLRWIRGRL